MINIERKRYIIVRGTDEILCGASNTHIFKKINKIGKKPIIIYSSLGKAYGTILRCKYNKCGARVVEVKETISEELNGLI